LSLLDQLPESRHDLHVRLTVSYHRKLANDPNTFAAAAVVGNVWRESIGVDAGGDLLTDRRSVFNVYRTSLTAAGITQIPKPGDVIEIGGERYVSDNIEHHERDSFGIQRYRMDCVRER
jgi:hypothetical protein